MRSRPGTPLPFTTLCIALWCMAGVAHAASAIQIQKGDCATGVHLTARGARLSDVLKELSTALKFELRFESLNDPTIDVDVVRQPVDLVKKLAPEENLSLTQARDATCPKRDRLVKVWVHPTGKAGAPRTTARTPAPMSNDDREAYELYLKAHGMRMRPDGHEEVIPPGEQR